MSAAQKAHHPAGADRLGQDGSQCGALYSHVKYKDENGVQDDVEYGADEHAEHSHQSFALGTDKGVQSKRQLNKDRAQQVDADVIHRVADGGVGRSKGPQNRFLEDAEAHRQHRGHDEEQGGGVAQNPFCLPPLAGAQLDGGQGSASLAGEGGERRYQGDNGKGNPHAGEGGLPHHWDVSDIDAVYNIVEHIDDLRGNGGDRQLEHQSADRGRSQGGFVAVGLCHRDPSSHVLCVCGNMPCRRKK